MSADLERAIRSYAEYLDETLPTVTADEIGTATADRLERVRPPLPWYRRPIVVFVAAMAAVLLIALVPLLLSGGGADVVETPTTTAPPPDAAPTTLPPSKRTVYPDGAIGYGPGQAAIATDGSLWTVTERAVVRWDLDTGAAVAFGGTDDLPPDAPRLLNEWRRGIRPVAVGSDGTLWIAEGMDLLLRSDGVTETSIALPRNMMASPWANALAVAPDGTLWATPNHETHVFAYDGAEWAVFGESDGVPAMPFSIAVAPNGTVWVGSTGIYGDPDGNVLPTGVARFDGNSWTQYTTNDGLLSNDASVVTGPDGTVWLIHHGLSKDLAAELGVDPMPQGLSRFDGDSWATYSDIAVNSDAVVATDGTLWMAFDESLVGFDGTNTTRYDVSLDSIDAAAEAAATRTARQTQTARQDGELFDPTVHDLCSWFNPQEIAEIVADAYLAQGAEPPPGAFATDDTDPGEVGCTWYSEVDGARLFGEDGGSLLAMGFPDASHPEIRALDEQPHEFTPYGWDDRVRIGNLSKGVWAYIQGVHATFTVSGHAEVVEFLHWAPHHSTERAGPINPVGLAIADEMLRRIGWVEGESEPDAGSS